jgi:hypothetical protein
VYTKRLLCMLRIYFFIYLINHPFQPTNDPLINPFAHSPNPTNQPTNQTQTTCEGSSCYPNCPTITVKRFSVKILKLFQTPPLPSPSLLFLLGLQNRPIPSTFDHSLAHAIILRCTHIPVYPLRSSLPLFTCYPLFQYRDTRLIRGR